MSNHRLKPFGPYAKFATDESETITIDVVSLLTDLYYKLFFRYVRYV
jgi:hypothetical protein